MTTSSARNRSLRRLARRVGTQGDQGSALVLVVGSMLILAMLSLTALAYAGSGQKFARRDQDYTAAVTAAQTGIEDFISRLNSDDAYGLAPDCLNAAWRGPVPTTPANPCGWNPSTPVGWVPASPTATSSKDAFFHYSVDTSRRGEGMYGLTVTGRVNGVYRTTEVTVGKGGSTDYVYYTDFESADPSNVQAYPPAGTDKVVCGADGSQLASYWHSSTATDGKPTRSGKGCVEITFTGNDVLDGQVFTNDTILGSYKSGTTIKPQFLKQVYTADPDCASAGTTNASWEAACLRSGSVANFSGVKPQSAGAKYLDDTSAAFATLPGCHYYGSTRVVFNGSNGKMTVWNKKLVNGNTPPLAIPVPGGVSPDCGSLSDLDNDAGATIDVPTEMVIYAATSPSAAAQRQCYAKELGGPIAAERLPVGNFTASTVASGTGQTYRADPNMLEPTKRCGQGNLYAEGVLKGRVTLAAAQSIVVTGDLVLAGGINGPDMLGLVATNSVEIMHPRIGDVASTKCDTYDDDGTTCTHNGTTWRWAPFVSANETEVPSSTGNWPKRYVDPTSSTVTPANGVQIAGSIQTLQHSFLVQKYNVGGDQGTLLVNGSIAQRWRGIVGQTIGSTFNGYAKLYRYDSRLQLTTPPYFPKWANSQWTLRYSGEISTPSNVKQ